MPSKNTNVNYKFERIEKKFWITKQQYESLINKINDKMIKDDFDKYTICNIYYDTKDYMLIRKSIERPFFKEKLRLRSYGIPKEDDEVFVEIKSKLDGIGYKRRIKVPFNKAKILLKGIPINYSNSQIEKELLSFVERYKPKARVYLTYDRYALTSKNDKGFRITFDQNLRYRLNDTEFPSDKDTKPIIEDETLVLMEIKSQKAIPIWFKDIMSDLKIYQKPFSKIGTCYTMHIAPNITY